MKAMSAPLRSKGLLLRGVLKGLVLSGVCHASTAYAATFTVTNTNDIGAGSLRQAIISANSAPGADTINFNITGTGIKTISVGSGGNGPLPIIEETVTIDGYTQPGAQPNTLAVGGNATLLIVISGSNHESLGGENGLESAAPNCVFRGLVINRFPNHALYIGAATGNRIEGCYIGTNAAGTAAVPYPDGFGDGVHLATGADNAIIGGTSPAARNVISGNTDTGVWTEADNGVIQNNYLGTNAAGTVGVSNFYDGIFIAAGGSNNLVGGTQATMRNIISANVSSGVCIEEFGADNNIVQGNYIGSNATGTAGLAARFQLPTGQIFEGNQGIGLEIMNGPLNCVVGGIGAGQGNLIAYNDAGVVVAKEDDFGGAPATGHSIRGNRIFNNTTIGIDLGEDSVTANDLDDPDSGPNNLQNFPVITSLPFSGGTTFANGTLNSRPGKTYVLDFYANSRLNAAGLAEGENYITSAIVTTNSTGDATFSVNLGADFSGRYITATATQTTTGVGFNDTSEFSAPRLVAASRSVQFSAPTYVVNEAAGTATITVTRSGDTSVAATVSYATSDDTATAGNDYTSANGTLNFAAGQTTQTFTVPITEDSTDEANETITLTLSNATGGSLGTPATAILTIADNDAAPSLSINDISVTETPNGTNAVFTVTLSAASGQLVTVNYATTNGSSNPATAGSDYGATNGQLTFAKGQTARTITVPIFDDTLTEFSETFVVNLSGAVNATIGDNQGVATIADNEVAPTLSINDVTVNEGTATGTVNATFSVTLSMAAAQTVTVNYATVNGTAVQPADYTAQNGTLSFAPGQTSKTITVVVKGDALDEIDEVFRINLSNASSNAAIGASQGIGTITDNDPTPTLSINDVTVTEGNSATATVNATFTVTLSAPSGQTVAISAIAANGSARSPGDYTATGARLTFAPGETSKTVSVPVKGDLLDEVNETFFVILSSPTNVGIGRGRGVGTITDDDVPPTISIDDLSFKEYNAGQTTAAVRLRLSAPSGQVVRVSYATANGTAIAGSDYVAVAPTVVAFNVGSTVAYARVLINGDVLHEPNETFLVNLSSPQNAAIAGAPSGSGQGVSTILNDDTAPALSINDVSVAEGNAGTKLLTFTVTLSKTSGQTITVNYATANGTAQAGTDYVAQNGTLTFAPGSALTRTVSIVINGDAVVEGNETLLVLLSGATNASISKARGVGTITNDDASG
jgi:hypothetical protein